VFTVEQRDALRDHVLQLAEEDERVAAGAAVGSLAVDGGDRFSDLDLTFGVADHVPIAEVLDDWTRTLVDARDAVHLVDLERGPTIYRVFLLPDALQFDLSMTPAARFRPAGPRFRLLFGETALDDSEVPTTRAPGNLFIPTPSVPHEAHEVMSTFLADGKIDFQGDYYAYTGLFTAARPVQAPFPIKLGGMRGPRSFELAGEIADGLHTALAYSREALDFTADAFRRGGERAERDWAELDLANNMLGAIAQDSDAAREAARIVVAFYISSMPPELLTRNGVDPAEIAPIVEAFNRGDVRGALNRTPPSVGDLLSVAGTAQEWVERIERDLLPAGFRHLLVTFADPFLVEQWAGITIDGLPSLEKQLQLFQRDVMAVFSEDCSGKGGR